MPLRIITTLRHVESLFVSVVDTGRENPVPRYTFVGAVYGRVRAQVKLHLVAVTARNDVSTSLVANVVAN